VHAAVVGWSQPAVVAAAENRGTSTLSPTRAHACTEPGIGSTKPRHRATRECPCLSPAGDKILWRRRWLRTRGPVGVRLASAFSGWNCSYGMCPAARGMLAARRSPRRSHAAATAGTRRAAALGRGGFPRASAGRSDSLLRSVRTTMSTPVKVDHLRRFEKSTTSLSLGPVRRSGPVRHSGGLSAVWGPPWAL